MNDQNEEKYRQKVREVLADGRLTDLEDTTLGFYQHTLKISDETAMRIFDEVLKEVTAKAGEQPNAIDESGSALKNDLLSQSQETGKQTTDKESAERITYQSWDEFEKAQYQKGALYKEFMPIAKQFHDMLISTFQEENKPVEARYGESTFSFSVPKDLTKSRKRTFASFGMLNLVTQKCYIQNLYKEADDELPEGSRLYKKSDPTVYVYSFGSMSDFECVKPDLKVCIIRSYELLSSESISRKLLKEESKILVNTSASVKCQNDANIDANDEDGKTALIRAAQEGDKKTVELLLDRGTDIEAKTNDGLTALICAASEGHTETVELLLDKGADIEAKSNDSRTALILAASEGYPETVGLLLDKGADIEADEEDGWRALHFAASEGHTETVGLLLDKGADIESKDSNGVTALIQAAGLGKKETVALLIEKGADIEATTNKGGTPLFVAVANGQMECVKMLIGTGANVNVKNKEGKTLLMRAEEQGHTEIVKYLKKATLGKDRKDSSGKTVTPSTAGMNTFDSEHIYGMAYVYFDVVMQNDEQSKDEFQAKVHVINEKLSEWAQDSNRITEIMQNCWKTYIHDINDDRETYEGKLEQYIFEMKDNMSEEQLSIVIADLFEIVDISANAHKAEISMIKGLAEIFGFSLEVDQRDTIIKNTKDCLTKDTDPPYPGQFCIPGTLYEDRFSYMPFPKVVGKSTKYKAEDLFRRFTSDEVSKIVSKIETENKIPYLVFIKGILDSKMNLPNKAPYWFMPFVIAGRTEGVMLYFDQDGFWYNSENPIVLKQCSPAEMIDSIEIKEGHFNDFVMELFKKDMPSLTVDEGIISTMRISGNDKGRAVEVDIAEMHGEGYGPQLEIMEAIWNIWKDVVEKSRGASSYMFDPAIFKAFNSWQEVIDWAYESEEKSPGEKKSKEPGKVKAEDDIDARDEDGKTALIRAAEEGDTETVEMLLDREADIEAKTNDGRTALMIAAIEGHTETVQLLLDKGADIEAEEESGWRALHDAANNGHTETVRLLLDRGADIEAKDNEGKTALIVAADESNIETAALLIERGADKKVMGWTELIWAAFLGSTAKIRLQLDAGADIEAETNDGRTALIVAAEAGHVETVELLLDKGANIEAKDNDDQTALMHVAGKGHFKTVELLVDHAADVHASSGIGTALNMAAYAGHTETVELLIDKGIDIESQDNAGSTALMDAASQGHNDVVKLLIDKGADIEAKTNDGRTALMLAASEGHTEMVELLLDREADIEAKADDGRTALMIAASEGHTEAVALLLDKGADIEAKANDGRTALMIAASEGHTEVVELLLDREADIEATDNDGDTALTTAVKCGHAETAALLIERGADKKVMGWTELIWAAFFGSTEKIRLQLDEGADIEAKTNDGQTALIMAASEGHTEAVALLLDKGADIEEDKEDGWRALHFAASNGQTETVELLLDRGAGIEAKTNFGSTALILAASEGHTEAVALLLDKGADIEAEDEFGRTALIVAAAGGHTETVELLLDRGADIEADANVGRTALIVAAWQGCTETVQLLLDKGADIEADKEDGWRALICAASEGYTETVALLLDRGADIEAKKNDGSTALILAAKQGHMEAVALLLDKGADIEADEEDGWRALDYAASEGQTETVELLLDRGADIEAEDKYGWTALIKAAWKGHPETVELLLDREADIEAKTNDGETALMLAAGQGHTETVELLLDKGADIEADIKTDYEDGGHRALHFAAKEGRTETVALLLSRGADIEAKTNDCWTPLMRAAWSGHKEAVGLLLDKGADIEAEDDSGWRALHYAAVGGHTETVELLLDRGADIEAEDDSGWRALHCAANNGQTGTVDLILDRGGDVEAKDNEGKTALILAASEGHTETVALLLEKGADIETEDYEGVNTLMWAERAESSEIVEYLTKYIAARSGKTAIKKEKSEATLNEHKSNSKEKVGKGDSEFLSPHSIPEYPGEFYFLTEKYSSKPVRIKHVYRLSRGEELFRKLSASEVDTIVKKISTMKIIPKLTFVREILEEKYKIPVKDVPFWFIPFVILAEQIGCFLYIERNGIYANYKESKEVDACFSWESATDVTYDRGFPELEDNSDDKPKLSFSFTSDTDEEYPDSEAMVSTLVLKTDDGHLTINEFHGDEFGSQLLIVKTIWDLWKKVVDQTRNSDVWPQNDEVPNGPQYRYFDSWDTLIAWAKDTSTDQSQNDTRVDEKRSDGNIKVFDQNIELYRRKVMDVLADGVVSDLERTGLDFFQHKLKLTDEDALRIFEEVLAEVLEKAGERAVKTRTDTTERAAVEESMSEETVEEETLRKMRITYSTWDEFEKGQGEDPLKKRFMPLARKVHELVIEALGEQNLPYEVRYGGGTFSFSVPKDLAKSGKRTYARFGLLDRTKNRTYFDSLYMAEGESLPEGSQFMSDGSSRCSYDLASIEEFENVKQDIKKGVVKSYRILAK